MIFVENMELDLGIQEYVIPGGGVLRFNPGDPGLYGRFAQMEEQLTKLEQELVEKSRGADPQGMLELMNEADARAKQLLNAAFGEGNDFHKALGGVSLLAVCKNGQTVAQNLFAALGQVLEQGASRLVEAKLTAAKSKL